MGKGGIKQTYNKTMYNPLKIIGLTIDTNQVKAENIKADEAERILSAVSSLYDLSQIRRVLGTRTFTAYTYHLSESNLGESLHDYLQSK